MCEDCYPPEPMVEWNTNLKFWSKQEADLFSTRSVLFSATWPTSGTMRDGKVYAPRTLAHPHQRFRVFIVAYPRGGDVANPGGH